MKSLLTSEEEEEEEEEEDEEETSFFPFIGLFLCGERRLAKWQYCTFFCFLFSVLCLLFFFNNGLKQESSLFPSFPTTSGGMQNGRSVGIFTHRIHALLHVWHRFVCSLGAY